MGLIDQEQKLRHPPEYEIVDYIPDQHRPWVHGADWPLG